MPAPKKNPLTKLIKKGAKKIKMAPGKRAAMDEAFFYATTKSKGAKKAVVKVKPKPKAPTDAATKRGLKAANAKLSKGNAKRMYDKDKVEMIMEYNPKDSYSDAVAWSSHPGYASQKSNARLQKGKWSSEKQIARYQKKEIKDFRKTKKVNKKKGK